MHRSAGCGAAGALGLFLCLLLLLAVTASSAAAACSVPRHPAIAYQTIPAAGPDQALFARTLLVEINSARCRHGLSPIANDDRLDRAASQHSRYQAQRSSLGHTSGLPAFRTLSDRLDRVGVEATTGGENLARISLFQLDMGQPFRVVDAGSCQFADTRGGMIQRHSYASAARHVTAEWMKSPGHRRNILTTGLQRHGAAVAVDASGGYCGDLYVTEILAGK